MKYVLVIVAIMSLGGLTGCQPNAGGNVVTSDAGGSDGGSGSGYQARKRRPEDKPLAQSWISCIVLSHQLVCDDAGCTYPATQSTVRGDEYVVNSEAKPNVRRGHWRYCRLSHETTVQT